MLAAMGKLKKAGKVAGKVAKGTVKVAEAIVEVAKVAKVAKKAVKSK